MVDIVKLLPYPVTSFPSQNCLQRSKLFTPQVTLPKYFSHTDYCPLNYRINNNQTTRWIGKGLSIPASRLLDVSQVPYSLHRKIIHHEVSRHYPTPVDLTKSTKSKQQNASNESTTTPSGTDGTSITQQTSLSNGDVQSSRLFNTLSKHVTVRAEPLRPSNNFIYSSASTLTSWQRYWTSTHAQRRRKEASEPDPVLYRPKCEPLVPSRTHFVVLRDSPCPSNEAHQNHSRTPTPTNTDTASTVYDLTITSDKQITSTKEDESIKSTPHVSKIEFVVLSRIPLCDESNSSTIVSKSSALVPLKSREKADEKHLTEKSLSQSSSLYFRSDSELIEYVSKSQIEPKPITTKLYRRPLPEEKPKQTKKSPPKSRTRPKCTEKNAHRTSSPSKRKHPASNNRNLANKLDVSSVITTVSRSKYSEKNWDQAYVGLRFDPPTPPSSPSLLILLEDSDSEDHETSYEKSKIFENDSSSQVLKS